MLDPYHQKSMVFIEILHTKWNPNKRIVYARNIFPKFMNQVDILKLKCGAIKRYKNNTNSEQISIPWEQQLLLV